MDEYSNYAYGDDSAGSFDSYDPNAGSQFSEEDLTQAGNTLGMMPQEGYGYNQWTGSDMNDGFDFGAQSMSGVPDRGFLNQYYQDPSMSGPMSSPAQAMTQSMPDAMGSGIQDTLAKLFSNPSLLAKGIGALFEGQQNKKMGKSMNSIASRPAFDPFGSQRPFYQQQLQNTVQDPYSQPIVKAQADQLARAQRIIDAKAGRRSNMATSAPGVLAAQAAIAQKYMDSLQRPAGAYTNPDSGSLANLLSRGAGYDTQGSISPLLNVLGNATRTSDNQSQLEQLARILKGG